MKHEECKKIIKGLKNMHQKTPAINEMLRQYTASAIKYIAISTLKNVR